MNDVQKPKSPTHRGQEDETNPKTDEQHERRPEGPHATPENTNEEATPGAGTLPDGEEQDATGG